jgi:hypothetical protein
MTLPSPALLLSQLAAVLGMASRLATTNVDVCFVPLVAASVVPVDAYIAKWRDRPQREQIGITACV